MKKELKQLIKKFDHIGFLDYKIVIEDLKQYNSISDKLDYLLLLKKKYYDKFEEVIQSLSHKEEYLRLTENNSSIIWKRIFGEVNLVTPLSIQEPVYKIHFKDALNNNTDFSFWFLKYQAKELFNYLTTKKEFKNNINSTELRETFIKSELKIIKDEEIKTKELFLNKEIDVYNRLRNDYYNRKEIIILRILDGNYYKKNIAENVFAIGSLIVQTYYKHILLKPFLRKELEKKKINKKSVIQHKEKQDIKLTYFERISRELNIIAWAFECQFMNASTSVAETPMLHSKGRYLAGFYHITSNIEILKLQDYLKHYTERFEKTSNTILVTNELLKIHKKANNILKYYNENLTSNSNIVKEFHSNKPSDFKKQQKYFKYHSGKIITRDLNPWHIVFGKDAEHPNWGEANYNYLTDNQELALFCQKIIDFIDKFNITKQQSKDKNTSVIQKKYLKDLFETTELYDKAIKILIEKEFISKNGNSLKWIFTPNKEYTTNQTIIALIVVLEKKQYLKKNLKAVYKNIKNEFNITIDKGTYSRSSNAFKKDYDTKINNTNKSYIDLFKDDL